LQNNKYFNLFNNNKYFKNLDKFNQIILFNYKIR